MPFCRHLQPGKGAKASVLTRMIKPKQHLPNNDKHYRSSIVLEELTIDDKGKEYYGFQYSDDASKGMLLLASTAYVRVLEEGEKGLLFDDVGKGEDTIIEWKDSEARQLLFNDVLAGKVPQEAGTKSLADVYAMWPNYGTYNNMGNCMLSR
jgi:hypothetical protein